MGLDTSHGCWNGAYSAFNRWRDKLAELAGIDVDALDWDNFLPHNLAGEWDSIPSGTAGKPEPLLLLIAHYDCEGSLPSRFCTPLADRLTELLPLLPTEPGAGHIGDWTSTTQRFIDGLRRAAEANEDVDFY